MVLKSLTNIACILTALVSFNVNAAVINTLNGVDYEWLELTATAGQSRTQVEAQLIDVNSSLYGYQYASRSLIEALFLSYVPWDGLNGYHADDAAVNGASNFIADFGPTFTFAGNGTDEFLNSVDDFIDVPFDGYDSIRGLYGASDECGNAAETCEAYMELYRDAAGNDTLAYLNSFHGFDAADIAPALVGMTVQDIERGSFLVKAVPVPPAAYLFVSGLIGVFGIARRKIRT